MLLTSTQPPLLFVGYPGVHARWVAEVLRAERARDLGDLYAPAWMIDDRFSAQAVRFAPQTLRFGLVRDPWSWYVQVYAEALRSSSAQVQDALRTYGRGSTDFASVLYGMTHPEAVAGALAESRAPTTVPRPLGLLWAPAEGGAWRGFCSTGLGLASFTALYHLGEKREWQSARKRPRFAIDVFVDDAQVEAAMEGLLCRPLPWSKAPGDGGLARAPRAMATVERAALGLYTPETSRWVAEADAPLIELMGFAPGQLATKGRVVPARRTHTMRARASE